MNFDNLPIPKPTLEDIEKQRNKAIAGLDDAYNTLQKALQEAHRACQEYGYDTLKLDDKMVKYLLEYEEKKTDFYSEDKRKPKVQFIDRVSKHIDRKIWNHIIEATELSKLFDNQARQEFESTLAENPPPFQTDTCIATIRQLMQDAPIIFARGVANAFSDLDRRFKSHDGFKIGSRMIFDRTFSDFGCSWNYNKQNKIRDVERAFYQLDGEENCEKYAGIVGLIDEAKSYYPSAFIVESEYFKARVFKNGNLHLWFKRDDLLRKVNLLLADYYGEVIGESSEVADPSDMGPTYHITPAKNFGYFPTSDIITEKLFDISGLVNFKDKRILEPSAGDGAIARMIKKHEGYDLTCIEIQNSHCATLREQGFETLQKDFLECKVSDIGLFDLIIANPPFDRGRDCDHVRHMLSFLKPDGILISIMSASAELSSNSRAESLRNYINKTCKGLGWDKKLFFRDLPSGSFSHAGTNVNTVVLALKKV
jgi:predicted RNA methylase